MFLFSNKHHYTKFLFDMSLFPNSLCFYFPNLVKLKYYFQSLYSMLLIVKNQQEMSHQYSINHLEYTI